MAGLAPGRRPAEVPWLRRYRLPVEAFDRSWREVQLETLLDLSLSLVGVRTEDEVLEEILHRAVATLDARAGAVFDSWPPGESGRFRAVGLSRHEAGDVLRATESQRGRLEEGSAVIAAREAGGAPGGVLAAPLRWQGAMLGLVVLTDKESRSGPVAFDASDARLLLSIATLGAAALATARAFAAMDLERQRLEEENRALREGAGEHGLVGESEPARRVLELARRVAPAEVSVMIRGESGVGKERLARLIHALSPRAEGPFVALNCAALPESLLEAELFGIEEGVATGVRQRLGKLELAGGGTLFLDEVADLSLSLQAKLLRVVQERELERLGGRERIPLDVRLLTATNRPLEELVKRGEFREDLYYRLRVVVIEIPPLRQRRGDIPLLVRHFLDLHGPRLGRAGVRMSREAMALLMRRDYPGNIRELENLIQAALALGSGDEVTPEDLKLALPGRGSAGDAEGRLVPLREVERRQILAVLEAVGGRRSEAARILGIDRATLYRKMKRFAT